MAVVNWQFQRFEDLAPAELYALLRLRQDVFVVEQACAYADLDGADPPSFHLSAWSAESPVAYLRVIPPEVHSSGCPSLGRICTSLSARRTGLGRDLVRRGLNFVQERWPGMDCQIGAQAYLRKFYEGFQFEVNGEAYNEDGIRHFPMRWYSK